MLNFDILDKGLGIVSAGYLCMIFQQKSSSSYVLLTDQILLSGCLYFFRYLAICALLLFVNQVMMS